MTQTISTKLTDIRRAWHLIDLKGKIIGREATKIAQLLMGKSKPYFVRNMDCGDYVVLINSRFGKVTGSKADQKEYQKYSGYPGGLKRISYKRVLAEDPDRIIKEAVKGMLPKNKLRDSMLTRFFVYTDEVHPYEDKIPNSKHQKTNN